MADTSGIPTETSALVAGGVAVPTASVLVRLADVLRDIARGALAGVIAGLLIGGVGGRILMTISALISPQATGLRTENGQLVGTFTVEGTAALLLFGGLFSGLMAGVVWVTVSPWLPSTGPRRWLLAMPVAVSLGSFFLIGASNPDFVILAHVGVQLAMYLGLVALIGAGVAWLDERLDRRLPRPGARPILPLIAYGVIAALGAPILLMTLRAYFVSGAAAARAPFQVGLALVAIGLATLLWWAWRIVTGRSNQPVALVAAARIALLVAVVLGMARITDEVLRILAR